MTTELILGTHRLSRPLLLAPMEDVSTPGFRLACRRLGADIVYTEFVHAASLVRGARESVGKLRILPDEHPVGIQIFGEDPGSMADAARAALAAGPDLIDVNIGCPVRKVVAKGAGAALLKDLRLTERILRAVVSAVPVPVTAKARLGWDASDIRILDLARLCEAAGVRALTVHARTRDQGYGGRADWRWIARVKSVVSIPVFGNGDVTSPEDACRMFDETGCDGVMLGRAAIGDPWIFRDIRALRGTGRRATPPSDGERIALMLELLESRIAERGEMAAVREMRKLYGPFLRRVAGGTALRPRLVAAGTLVEVREILESASAGEGVSRGAATSGPRAGAP